MGQLPAGLAYHPPQPRRHAAVEGVEAELAAHIFGRLDIRGLWRPGPARAYTQGKGLGEHVVLVGLGGATTRRRQASLPRVWRSSPRRSRRPASGTRRLLSREAMVDLPPPERPSSRSRSPTRIRGLHP